MQALQSLRQNYRWVYAIFIVPLLLFCFVYEYSAITTSTEMIFHTNSDYLINTPQCQVPDLDAWNPDAKSFYKKEKYVSCSSNELLTKLVLNENQTAVRLIVVKKLVPKYSKEGVKCCVSDVHRGTGDDIDNKISYTKCRQVENYTIAVPNDLPVMVSCRSNKKKKEVYKNVHVPIALTPSILEKRKNFKAYGRPLSVLVVGIDSISRLNMIRTMPKTRSFLKDPHWVEYKVYHKIGDNTFPNLIAMLTGMDPGVAYKQCDPRHLGGINKCDFMWKHFNQRNYVTAYVEDSAHMSTFNYKKKGFDVPPTDYYMRSYQLACVDLKVKVVDSANYCTGPEMEGERVWRMTRDFVKVHQDNPYFAFFWTNSYSHQQLNTPTRMDAKVRDYMSDITKLASNNTVVIFLSDHGLRFGKIRHTLTGYIEERMPFLFMKFPKWFQEQFPEEYKNLRLNHDKLVTPYDLYMTLQDVLQYSGFDYDVKQADGCPNCQTLFAPVDMNRSCDDVSIATHWCTCLNYREDNGSGQLAQRAAKTLLDKLATIIDERNATHKCAKYSVAKVVRTYKSQCYEGTAKCDQNLMVIIVETKPLAFFEATLSLKWPGKGTSEDSGDESNVKMELYTGISRLDTYSHSGRCTEDTYLKLLCSCK